ncbi:MAG: 1-acyl-sn-glycerol-3-phosphate acyltransferase [Flavobacteriales bacterium]|nr:1-acyl-sn-glycerol-3-phosphate acyltransferase [Flavobacteriales bacterium]
MKKLIANIVFKLFGWKTVIEESEHLTKCVMIAAPHTSNWDFLFTVMVFWKHDIMFRFFVKDSYTESFILGPIARMFGAIGVDRSKGQNLVEFASNLIKSNKNLVVLVPAEGTRKRVEKWKTGFYYIAKSADVPVALGYLDFEKKVGGVGPMIFPSDNMNSDFDRIQDFYFDKVGKHPELYNPKIYQGDFKT